MKSRPLIDRLALVIILINTLLMLAGVIALRYDQTRQDTEHWSPGPPPAFVDPFRTYREPIV